MGVESLKGSLEDHESLKSGAKRCDGIIHLAFIHDFASPDFDWVRNTKIDQAAIAAMVEVIKGTGKALLITGGTAGATEGGAFLLETDVIPTLRAAAEEMIRKSKDEGWTGVSVRLSPTVHGPADPQFIPFYIHTARTKGVAGYLGDGSARWSAIHVQDAATLFRLALEKAPAGCCVHGVAEEGVKWKDIAETVGRKLGVPVEVIPGEKAGQHFQALAMFLSKDSPCSNKLTKEWTGWEPTEVGLIEDLETGDYFEQKSLQW